MLEWFIEYGMFLAKVFTVVFGIIICIAGVVAVGKKKDMPEKGQIKVKALNKHYETLKQELEDNLLEKDALNALRKEESKAKKKEAKQKKKDKHNTESKPRLFIIDFDGDIKASQAENLAKEVNSVIISAKENDEVLLRLESPGGVVHGYGLAASQLQRLRNKNIPLTVCVDKVAASGGYMMASVANKIIAAPFAVIGSIGVVAQLPNFNRLLKKHNVDYDIYTAGKYKRTVTVFGENTEEGKQKLNEDLQTTHDLFKAMIKENRSELDVDSVATGEIWYGTEALQKKLIDEVNTSDDVILSQLENFDLFKISYEQKKSLSEKIGIGSASIIEKIALRLNKSFSQLHS